MNVYGVLDSNNCHIDTSNTEKGAKRHATLNGYEKVSIRYNCGYHVEVIAEKVNGKWVKPETLKPFEELTDEGHLQAHNHLLSCIQDE